MQQRVEILKMLYRDNEILIFDEPTAVLTPQEIDELMEIMRELASGGQVHSLHLPQAQRDHGRGGPRARCCARASTSARSRRSNTTKEELSDMMVGRNVQLRGGEEAGQARRRGAGAWSICPCTPSMHKQQRRERRFASRCGAGEIVCIAGIDGNGQTELVYGLTGLEKLDERHDHALRQGHHPCRHPPAQHRGHEPHPRGPAQARPRARLSRSSRTWCSSAIKSRSSRHGGFIRRDDVRAYAERLIEQYDVRSGQGADHHRAQHVRRQPAEGHRRPRDRPRHAAASSPCSPRAAWTSARSNTSTSSSSPSATRARPCCSCRWSWTRS